MIFAPHILQVKMATPLQEDDFGHAIPNTGGEEWATLCKCRCDDNTTREFNSPNGEVYRPNYHVVCDGKVDVSAGVEVRCVDGCIIRGKGKVYIVKYSNYFNKTELWM